MRYEEKILGALLDSYENSLLSRGENKVAIHVSFPFTKKTMPAYFDESSLTYEEIHGTVRHLEEIGFIEVVWKGKKENHIIQKVILCEDKVSEIYRYIKRTPKSDLCAKQLEILQKLQETSKTPVASAFISWLRQRLDEGKYIKEYLDLEDSKATKELISAITSIEENQQESYIREFSVQTLGDSKMLENRLSMIGKIMRKFSLRYENMDTYEILAEYGIYHTPNYVYVKGTGSLRVGTGDGSIIKLECLRQGIGLSGEDLDSLRWEDLSEVKRVITIENLTTFFRWEEEHAILIYLGGYHNTVRRNLLKNIYNIIPYAEYLHFGDIDVGGFEIYLDLCKKTGIPFQPYLMGISQLEEYKSCARKLTENDRKRLSVLKEKTDRADILPVLMYMETHGIKLEQESIRI